ncbi:MAG: hypothetical protein ACQESX_05095 [Bacteroidota bacterium]
MHCSEFEKNIISFHEGILEQETASEMQSHMQQCNTCKRLYQEVTATYDVVDQNEALPEFSVETFYEGIREKLSNANPGVLSQSLQMFANIAASIVIMTGLASALFLTINLSAPATTANNEDAYIQELTNEFHLDTEEKYAFETYYQDTENNQE